MVGLKRIGLILTLVIFTLLIPLQRPPQIQAAWNINPPSVAGFPAALGNGGVYSEASLTLADANGDGQLEIFVGKPDESNPNCRGRLYAVNAVGTVLWNIQTRAPIHSTPAVADIDNDGVPEVVVGLGSVQSENCANGGVLAVNAQTGAQKWIFDTQDWLNHAPNGFTDPVFSSPTIADLDHDGDQEIVFGAWDQCIYMLNGAGIPLWPELNAISGQHHCGMHGFYNEDVIWSSPAVADLNGDGILEIITGADITAGNRYGDPSGGYLYVLDINGAQLARRWFDQRLYSSPAVGDIDADGKLEIVIGTGTHLANKGYYTTAWNFVPGAPVTSALAQKYYWATSGRVFTSPALADLNKNGGLDVVIISNVGDGAETGGQDLGSKVFAWDGKTGAKLFETMVCDWLGNAFITHSSPVVADITGDGNFEILFSHAWEIAVLNRNGTYYTDYSSVGPNKPACARTVAPTTQLTFYAANSVYGTPAVGDLNGDGGLEVVASGGQNYAGPNPDGGAIYAWKPASTGALAWPMFRRDARHTGRYLSPPGLSVIPSTIFLLHQQGDPSDHEFHLTIKNTGDQGFNWTATSTPSVTLSHLSGTVVTQALLTVTAHTGSPSYALGTYDFGPLVFEGLSGANPVAGSPATVPVTVKVVEQIYPVFLPIVKK